MLVLLSKPRPVPRAMSFPFQVTVQRCCKVATCGSLTACKREYAAAAYGTIFFYFTLPALAIAVCQGRYIQSHSNSIVLLQGHILDRLKAALHCGNAFATNELVKLVPIPG